MGQIELDEFGEIKNQQYEIGSNSSTNTVSILLRGSNRLVLDEAERSLHDALCVVRCLVKNRALLAGGGSPEMECAIKLREYARTVTGGKALCIKAFSDALEV